MEKPLVSIITPTYNHEKFIRQCIKSVLSQTYPNWEMIIIDDGSTDKTQEKVEKFNDERIHYIRQKNVGIWRLKRTYNRALKFSEGEIIAILEGDDFWPPYKLERQIQAFKKENVVLSWGKAVIVDSEGRHLSITPSKDFIFHKSRYDVLRKLLLFWNFIPACTVMVHKEALLSIGGFKQPSYLPYVDYPTWLELSLIGEFYPINDILGYWRRHRTQVTMRMAEDVTKGAEYSLDFFRSLPDQVVELIGVTVDDIVKHRIAYSYFYLGKFALTNGKWVYAKENFKKAMDIGSFPIKLKALLGMICSKCKINII